MDGEDGEGGEGGEDGEGSGSVVTLKPSGRRWDFHRNTKCPLQREECGMGGILEPIRLMWLRIHLGRTKKGGGIHTLRATSCSRLFCLIGNLHKYNILELRPNVCLSEAATFKRQGQVRRCFSEKCEKGADRLKINASHGRQVGGVNNKNRFSLPFSCSRSSFLSFDVSHTNIGWYQLVSQRLLDITRNSAITKKKETKSINSCQVIGHFYTH